jgi:hypothetical protein
MDDFVKSENAEVRTLIEAYRVSRHCDDPTHNEVLPRLTANPDGKVSSALKRLRYCHAPSLIGVIVEAAHLAKYGATLPAAAIESTADMRRLAANARELVDVIKNLSPGGLPGLGQRDTPNVKLTLAMLQVAEDLPVVAGFFDQMGDVAQLTPSRLFVTNKHNGERAAQLRALRLVARYVRKKPGGRVEQQPIISLVEVALGVAINDQDLIKTAFRKPRSGD